MANSDHHPAALARRGGATSPGWTADAVALASAGVFAVALKLALQIHIGVAPMIAAAIAVAVYGCLAALHIVLRPRPSRLAPAHDVSPRRRPRSSPQETRPLDADVAGPASGAPIVSAATSAPARPGVEVPASDGFEHLQSLVAELARATPGPKAATPDPDAVQAETAAAWARYVAEKAARAADGASPPASAHVPAPRPLPASTPAAQAVSPSVNPGVSPITRSVAAAPAPVPSRPVYSADVLTGFAAELSDALAAERMTIYLEPIQQIESDRPRHYEVSVRFKDAEGAELPHEQVLAAARDAGLLPRVDAAILPRAARIAQHFQLRGRDTEIVSRVHGASLPDQDFRNEVTAATIAADGAALVLSFEQSDVRTFGPIHWEILSTIADMGLRFAIESVTDLDMDFEALAHRGFTFVKLDADVLLEGLPATGAIIASADVCRHFATAGLALIVNHIDDEQALARILGFGILFGQGALFGTKRAVRADILATSAAA